MPSSARIGTSLPSSIIVACPASEETIAHRRIEIRRSRPEPFEMQRRAFGRRAGEETDMVEARNVRTTLVTCIQAKPVNAGSPKCRHGRVCRDSVPKVEVGEDKVEVDEDNGTG